MSTFFRLFLFACSLTFLQSCSSASNKTKHKREAIDYTQWVTLTKGMEYREIPAPQKSFIGDSKLSILRLDPSCFGFDIFSATQHDSVPRTVKKWAHEFDQIVTFNAGMYEQTKPLQSRAYLQNGKHYNNPKLLDAFNLMLALGPKEGQNRSNIEVLDLSCSDWRQEKKCFKGFAQGLRMIDCNGQPTYWQKKIQSCSMLVAAEDNRGWFYLIFTRSPYTHNQMIDFMLQMPRGLHDAIYLEGGPETSLFIHVNQHHIQKVGSWVSDTWETNRNKNYWPLPNVIGITYKN